MHILIKNKVSKKPRNLPRNRHILPRSAAQLPTGAALFPIFIREMSEALLHDLKDNSYLVCVQPNENPQVLFVCELQIGSLYWPLGELGTTMFLTNALIGYKN